LSKIEKIFGVENDRKIYGNYQVLSPDGILMFRCDLKKINWYIKRDLAEFLDERTIKLKFKPNGLGNHNKSFGLSLMENKCVVCGSDEFLTKHHVVPISYRKHFPIELKSHNFHDVLSMCANCHESYERKADLIKLEISKKYNAPINGEIIDRKNEVKWSKIASTLLGDYSKIPKSRIKQLKSDIKSHFNIKRLTNKRLKNISSIKSTVIKKTHGEIVLGSITDIQEFIEMWREHFIINTSPKYLPQNWSIKTI
jgi:hypothetical protein